MSKKEKKKKIKSLNSEIQLVQIEKFINDFDSAMKKNLRSQLKKGVLITGPLILSLIGYLILKNPTLLIIGTSITGIGCVTSLTNDFIKDIKSSKRTNSNIINAIEEKDVDQILQDGIGKMKEDDFYSGKYKSAIKKDASYVENEEEKKYKKALEKQQHIVKNDSTLKIIGNDTNYLDKDATMIQVVREIDAYTVAYDLLPLEISNSQWDLFFDTIYNFFDKKGIENKFYELMSQVGRFVCTKSLLNKQNKISIYDFIENLYYLESETIEKKEIAILQQEILSKFPPTKIINFSDCVSEKGKRK